MLWPARKKIRARSGAISFKGFPHGLNTAVPAAQLAATELSRCVNWKINKGGQLETRRPLVVYSNSATTGDVYSFADVPIGSTTYKIVTDTDHKVYYLDGSLDPTLIGTAEDDVEVIAYNGYCIILDGSYIKYLDDVSSIKIAYDAGSGSSGFQFDNTAESQDSTLALGDGTNTRVAQKFTTQSWTAGYTIPPVKVTCYLSKTGSPTGSITVKIRKTDDTEMASKTFLSDVSTLTGTAASFNATFASGDISNELSPGTAYYCSLEYSGGDGSNYVDVHTHTVASGGLAYHYDGSWNADATSDCVMSMSPGKPPKASFGVVHSERLYVAGDPDNPGYIWYGNLSHLDWSSSDGGGYVGAVDDNSNNYEVGGMATLFNDLYVFGTQVQPYIAKLTGSSPSNYVVSALYQNAWTLPRTLVNAKNDLWSANSTGVDSLSGVQEYGDVRTWSYSDPIKDRIQDYWSSSAFAGYYPDDGQYWLYPPGYHRILVCHTKTPVQEPTGLGVRYPWSEYELCMWFYTEDTYKWTKSGSGTNEYYCELLVGGDPSIDQPDYVTLDGKKITKGTAGSLNDHEWDHTNNDGLTYNTLYIRDESGDPDTTGVVIRGVMKPTAFGMLNNKFMVGSGGYVYYIDTTEYKELTTERIYFDAITAYPDFPLTYVNLSQYQITVIGTGGGEIDITLYKDGYLSTAALTFTLTLTTDETLTVDEATMDVGDAYFLVDPTVYKPWRKININARSIQIRVSNVKLGGYPLFLNGHLLKYRSLSY